MKKVIVILLCLFAIKINAANVENEVLNLDQKKKIIEKIGEILSKNYIYPEKAQSIEQKLVKWLAKEEINAEVDSKKFAMGLSRKLVEITNDLHFTIKADPYLVKQIRDASNPKTEKIRRAQQIEEGKLKNFGFNKISILEGNVGYLKFDYFEDPDLAGEKVASIMHTLADVDALIIDLRDNSGGYLEMAQLINSYFFIDNKDEVIFFDFYYNKNGSRVEKKHWVLPFVMGERMTEIPLFILTSNGSFSAAEWMAYSLKHLGRATLVGEVTAGGAHPVEWKPINETLLINVPIGEIQSPATGSDFEGRGVTPHVTVESYKAIDTSHLLALDELKATSNNDVNYDWYKPVIESRLQKVELSDDLIDQYVGRYGNRHIVRNGDRIFYSWDGKFKFELTPLTETLFSVAGVDDFRMKMVLKKGKVVGFERQYRDGTSTLYKRGD